MPSCGGADGDRTRDLHAASVALSRLSYGPKKLAKYSKEGVGVNGRERPVLPLPPLLGSVAPEGFEAVVVAGFVGEDVNYQVEEVQADPGRALIETSRAGSVSLVPHLLQDFLDHTSHLPLGLGACHHEVVRVGDGFFEVYDNYLLGEHVGRRLGRSLSHVASELELVPGLVNLAPGR